MTMQREDGGWSTGAVVSLLGVIILLVGALVGGGISYGTMRSEVEALKQLVAANMHDDAVMHDHQRTNEVVIDQHSDELEMMEGKMNLMREYHQRVSSGNR